MASGLLLLVLVFLVVESWTVLRHVSPLRFLGDPSWHPAAGYYNLSPMLTATLLASVCALGLAVPLGLAAALFSVYYAPPYLARPLGRMIEQVLRDVGLWHEVKDRLDTPALGLSGGSSSGFASRGH